MWVVALVVGILAFQAVLWTSVFIWARGRRRNLAASIDRELADNGDHVRLGPVSAVYSGATGGYSSVKGNGVLVLTDRRFLFRKLTGGRVEVPIVEIDDLHESKTFQHSRVAGRSYLILTLKDGNEVGFMVPQQEDWMSATRQAIGR